MKRLFRPLFFLALALQSLAVLSYNHPDVDVNDPEVLERLKSGKALFRANCASCHAIERNLTGPALANVWERWESKEKLISWTRNSQAMIAAGDPYAVKIFNEWNRSVMSAFPNLDDDQIISIIDYIYAETKYKGWDGAPVAAPTAAGGEEGPNRALLFSLLALLVLMAAGLWTITSKLDKVVRESEGEEVEEEKSIGERFWTTKTKVILGLVLGTALVFNIANGAVNLGRQQGYAPEQPIKFSHELHAGQLKIDCQFCHSGARKGKHANIPAVNVCMSCHKYVQEGPKYGTKEIDKIYAAAGWDPEEQAYTSPQQPIKWVRIHNLPDHVYFNHAQHVAVGGVDCQTCHGPVETMEVLAQFAPLSMGWCLNCHRQTDVQFTTNNYYSIFDKYHEELKKGSKVGVTVEDIGGADCQKCHY